MTAPTILLETDRLRFREFVEDDVEACYELGRDPVVTRYTGDGPLASLDQALAILRTHPLSDYRKYGFGRWACILKESGRVIGFAGLKYLDDVKEVDLGYRLLPAHWGAGLATEASKAVVAYGFNTLKLGRIIGLVHPENVASIRVLEKVGMRFDGFVDYRGQRVGWYVIAADAVRGADRRD